MNNEVFVANDFHANGTVTICTLTANGNATPLRTIAGAVSTVDIPRGLAVDAVNNELVAVQISTPAITVNGRIASGNAVSLRTIVGTATGLNGLVVNSVDNFNNEMA